MIRREYLVYFACMAVVIISFGEEGEERSVCKWTFEVLDRDNDSRCVDI